MIPKLYELQEVQKILNLSIQTLRRYVRENRLQAVKIGRHYKVTEEALQRFIDSAKKNF